MKQISYKGITYNTRKELKEATGLSWTKINAKIKDNEIIFINTGETPYEINKITI